MQFLAAAVLAAALVTSQFSVATVMGECVEAVQENSMIPDNITIDHPVPLSEIELPKSEYGMLSWADDSLIPSARVQSYEVIFEPYDRADLARFEEWDGKSDLVYTNIKIVVSSISKDEDYEISGEVNDDEKVDGEASAEDLPEKSEILNESEDTQITENNNSIETENSGEKMNEAESSVSEVPEEDENISGTPEISESLKADEDQKMTEDVDLSESAEGEKNIFDGSEEISEDDQIQITDTELSDEEKAELAQMNHTCNGISVSGINLPWYVQFRVASGEKYAFSNEADANVFKAYEFELWDLRNNTEYEIPDGEYISVTVPVKEGYDYTIEHILDSGAMETIIPSVEGSTMVFSTHSFSPFGIAGSKALVGEEIEDGSYSTNDIADAAVPVTSAPADTDKAEANKNSSGSSNSKQSDNSEAQTVTDSEDQAQTDADSTSSQAVNTGDNTPILPFVLIGAAAIVLIAVLVYLRKKK